MNLVYLIRHGQAGSRQDYDRLSTVGRQQALLLGKWLALEEMRFDVAIVGGLRRQRETAEIVLAELGRANLAPPQVMDDPRWSEFDIDAVFDSVAPRLAADDEGFRRGYERILSSVQNGDGGVHREWTPTDTRVVESWIAGEYETEIESWNGFTGRVREGLEQLPSAPRVAVFTSATPAAICIAHCFDTTHPRHILHMAGASLNTNITTVVRQNGSWGLGGFNQVPHLNEKGLRTFR